MGSKKELTREQRVAKEMRRLKRIYADIPDAQKNLAEGLIVQAARLRVMLDDMWEDIADNGDTEMFSQSEKTDPYERERPVARLFNARDKNYQTIIKMLNEYLPTESEDNPAESLQNFISRRPDADEDT